MATNQTLSLAVASLGLGIALTIVGAGAPPPDPAPATIASVQEDDPAFDCLTMGNLYCGDPDGTYATEAWAAWDKAQAWKQLRVAATNVRVEYVGFAKRSPNVDALTQLAVPSRTGWFVFQGTVTTEPEGN